jgi:hypothetical protein
MVAAKRLQVMPTTNDFAGLRVFAYGIVVVDVMFSDLITRRGRRPMLIDGRPDVLSVRR